MRQYLRYLTLSLLLLLCSGSIFAAPPKGWEQIKGDPQETRSIIKEDEVEVKMTKGAIIITSSHPIQVKVFSILGQLVSSETLPAGSSRLTINGHGVYIVKIGDLTCKVAL